MKVNIKKYIETNIKKGAVPMEQWTVYRVTGTALKDLETALNK